MKGSILLKLFSSVLLLGTLFLPLALSAQAPPSELPRGEIYTRITSSRIHKYKIVISGMPVETPGLADSAGSLQSIREIVLDDLEYSLRFDLVNRKLDELSIAALNSAKGSVDFKGWQSTGAEYLVAGSFVRVEKSLTVEIRVYDLGLEDLVFLKSYVLDLSHPRIQAHRISDDVVLNVTGERGIASTRIAFIRETAPRVSEVFCCDYDGYEAARVTNNNLVTKLPTWNPDGTRIAFTGFTGLVTDPDLYLIDLANGKISILQAAKGVDMAASWCERNGFLAFSSGFSGNQEIYFLRPGESKPQRLTFSFAMDFEPSWSPNGEELAFTSTRAGNPHIFIMGADGLNVRRLTFESRNTSPRWRPLPYGDKILLTSEIGSAFQIAIIDTNGDNFIQLTTDGENRDASWSPDGLHIDYASDRRGGRGRFEIYSMDWDGNSQRPLNKNFTGGREPFWSPFMSR